MRVVGQVQVAGRYGVNQAALKHGVQVLEDFMREMQLYESGAAESTVFPISPGSKE